MIVLVIIGIMYTLLIGRFRNTEAVEEVTLAHLRESLTLSFPNQEVFLHCTGERCDNCKLQVNHGEARPWEGSSIFTEPPVVYRFDSYGYLETVHYPDDDTCFQYRLYSNGSGSHMLVKVGERYYLLPPYFQNTQQFTNADSAKEAFDPRLFVPTDSGEFYNQRD